MSYILDALRRAEVERQHGKVPALHAVHDGAVTAAAAPVGGRRALPPAVLAGAAVLFLLAGAAGAWLVGRSGAGVVPAAGAPSVAAVAVPTAQAPVISTPTIDKPVTATGVTASPALASAVPLAAESGVSLRPAKLQGTATATATAPDRPEPASAAFASAPISQPASAAAAGVERVPGLAELPEDFRRQLPAIALAGGMYSELAAQRLVIVNGAVVREGDQPATDLRVIQIRPRAVVFSFRGQLFVVNQ